MQNFFLDREAIAVCYFSYREASIVCMLLLL